MVAKTGVIAACIVAHVPTLALAHNTPDYQQTLVTAERALGAALRASLAADLWILVSSHWVATFEWMVTCQPIHEGVCVADEAPNLIPGIAYRYRGDAEFGAALVEGLRAAAIPAGHNDSAHYRWDYGTLVPLRLLDPEATTPVVTLPSVVLSDHDECMRVGATLHATAKRLGRRAILIASSALSHVLVRGRHHWPTPERVVADKQFIDRLGAGAIDDTIANFADYSRFVGAEMGGRPLATLLGAARAMAADNTQLVGRRYGDYAQSSGSGNVVLLLTDAAMLAQLA